MYQRVRRRGSIARVMAMTLTIVLGVPATVTLLAFMTFQSRLNAQQVSIATTIAPDDPDQNAVSDNESENREIAIIVGQAAQTARPITETFYEEETINVQVPTVDPKTGQRTLKTTQRVVRRPRTRVRWSQGYTGAGGGKAEELVRAIRKAEDSEEKDDKIQELRDFLVSEFDRMHEEQAEMIRETEERLAKLKSTHETRQEKRDTIVQRRIDQLLGQPDPLQWNPSLPEWMSSNRFIPGLTFPASPSMPAPPAPAATGQRLKSTSGNAAIPQPAPTAKTFFGQVATSPRPTAQAPAVGIGYATLSGGGNIEQREIDVTKLFATIEEAARVDADLQESIDNLTQSRELARKGFIRQSEVKQMEAAIAKQRQSTQRVKIQLDLLQAQLQKELEAAKLSEGQAKTQVEALTEQVRAGLTNALELTEGEYRLKSAENVLELAEYRLKQFEKALESLQELEDNQNASDESAEEEAQEDQQRAR